MGVFVIDGRTVDLWIMLAAGLFGYLFERLNIPLAPIVLGMILGPMAEQSLRRALLISRGDWLDLVTRPISAALILATIAMLLLPLLRAWRRSR